ncbi:hypothetical protein SEVIR_4G021033v4 [Setaria viridis]
MGWGASRNPRQDRVRRRDAACQQAGPGPTTPPPRPLESNPLRFASLACRGGGGQERRRRRAWLRRP